MIRIESRWPSWARWRKVTACLHSEARPFDRETGELTFNCRTEAEITLKSLCQWNAGEFRIVEEN